MHLNNAADILADIFRTKNNRQNKGGVINLVFPLNVQTLTISLHSNFDWECLSAFYVCCIYSNVLQASFDLGSNKMLPAFYVCCIYSNVFQTYFDLV